MTQAEQTESRYSRIKKKFWGWRHFIIWLLLAVAIVFLAWTIFMLHFWWKFFVQALLFIPNLIDTLKDM